MDSENTKFEGVGGAAVEDVSAMVVVERIWCHVLEYNGTPGAPLATPSMHWHTFSVRYGIGFYRLPHHFWCHSLVHARPKAQRPPNASWTAGMVVCAAVRSAQLCTGDGVFSIGPYTR
ncbi:hypothetical protein BDZ89DRAFT_1036275 [Hymenopellis radicata]|nr:hypothetical protein BDZ89DRAFT_1036275 [Hymenopellis radicata]